MAPTDEFAFNVYTRGGAALIILLPAVLWGDGRIFTAALLAGLVGISAYVALLSARRIPMRDEDWPEARWRWVGRMLAVFLLTSQSAAWLAWWTA